MQKLNLRHPGPLVFGLDSDPAREYSLPLPTRGQMRRALELELALEGREEDPAAIDELHAKQLAIFAEGTNLPLSSLTSAEEAQILAAVVSAHHGFPPGDAAAFVALAQSAKKSLAVMLAHGFGTMTPAHSTSPQS